MRGTLFVALAAAALAQTSNGPSLQIFNCSDTAEIAKNQVRALYAGVHVLLSSSRVSSAVLRSRLTHGFSRRRSGPFTRTTRSRSTRRACASTWTTTRLRCVTGCSRLSRCDRSTSASPTTTRCDARIASVVACPRPPVVAPAGPERDLDVHVPPKRQEPRPPEPGLVRQR